MPEKGKDTNKSEREEDHDNRNKNKGEGHDNRGKKGHDKRDKERDDSRDRDSNDGDRNKKDKRNDSKRKDDKKENKQDDGKDSKSKGRKSSSKRQDRTQSGKSKKSEETPRDGRSKQKEYFKEELRRLKDGLERESTKIVEPEKKEFTPDIFNKLEPYYNTDTPQYLIDLLENAKVTPEQVRHGYVSRQTAIGLCDPWVDLKMDVELLPKIGSKVPVEEEKRKSKTTPRNADGSTRLPKFPAVCVPTDDLTKNRKIYYDEVPTLREELKKKYSSEAEEKQEAEYKRTKDDFYRMELDKMDEYHPSAKPKMKATYMAYLANNPGSKKAIIECIEEKENEEKEENDKKEKDKKGKKDKRDHKDNRDKNKDRRASRDTRDTRDSRASSAKSTARSEKSQHRK